MMTIKNSILVCLWFVFSIFAPLTSAWAEPASSMSVMVYPLDIHADTSMDYLQTGICDLMVAKLTDNTISTVRADAVLPREEAVKQARDAHMDALIMGNLTFLGNSVGIIIALIDSHNGQNIMSFSRIEKDKDNVLNHVDAFMSQVAGEKTEPPAPVVNITPEPPPKTELSALSETIVRSEDIKAEIVALAVGNTDGDSQKDLVLADIHNLMIMNLDNGAFVQTNHIKGESYLNIIHVDTCDTNGNGRDEIIVSAVHARNSNPLSYAYEWDGSQYVLIAKSMAWFFRKGPCPFVSGDVLLGQQQQFSDSGFAKGLSTMAWDASNRSYIPQSPCPASLGASIYNYATGDLMNTGSVFTILYTDGDYLSVLKSTQEDIWTSGDRYGGSSLYLETKHTTPPNRLYLPARIETGDFDQDGRTDVVTLQNKNANPRIFSNLKNFVEGQVVCLSWKSLKFSTAWSSPKLSGYISDFIITDMDGDGLYDLVYSVLPKKTSVFGQKTSYVVLQSIHKASP